MPPASRRVIRAVFVPAASASASAHLMEMVTPIPMSMGTRTPILARMVRAMRVVSVMATEAADIATMGCASALIPQTATQTQMSTLMLTLTPMRTLTPTHPNANVIETATMTTRATVRRSATMENASTANP